MLGCKMMVYYRGHLLVSSLAWVRNTCVILVV